MLKILNCIDQKGSDKDQLVGDQELQLVVLMELVLVILIS